MFAIKLGFVEFGCVALAVALLKGDGMIESALSTGAAEAAFSAAFALPSPMALKSKCGIGAADEVCGFDGAK